MDNPIVAETGDNSKEEDQANFLVTMVTTAFQGGGTCDNTIASDITMSAVNTYNDNNTSNNNSHEDITIAAPTMVVPIEEVQMENVSEDGLTGLTQNVSDQNSTRVPILAPASVVTSTGIRSSVDSSLPTFKSQVQEHRSNPVRRYAQQQPLQGSDTRNSAEIDTSSSFGNSNVPGTSERQVERLGQTDDSNISNNNIEALEDLLLARRISQDQDLKSDSRRTTNSNVGAHRMYPSYRNEQSQDSNASAEDTDDNNNNNNNNNSFSLINNNTNDDGDASNEDYAQQLPTHPTPTPLQASLVENQIPKTFLAEAEPVEPVIFATDVVRIEHGTNASADTSASSNANVPTSRDDDVADSHSSLSRDKQSTRTFYATLFVALFVIVGLAIIIPTILLPQEDGDDDKLILEGSMAGTFVPSSPRIAVSNRLELEALVDVYLDVNSVEFNSNNDSIEGELPVKSAFDVLYGAIEYWDVSAITNFTQLFSWWRLGDVVYNFEANLSQWDVSSAIRMNWLFHNCSIFESDLSSWDVSSVTDTTTMFFSAYKFNSDLSKWDVSKVTKMTSMFARASSFESDLSKWDVSNCTDMSYMFLNATSFDSDLSDWNVTNVMNMKEMFAGATNFVGKGLDHWVLNKNVVLTNMFCNAESFDKTYISSWNIFPWNIYC